MSRPKYWYSGIGAYVVSVHGKLALTEVGTVRKFDTEDEVLSAFPNAEFIPTLHTVVNPIPNGG